MSAKFEVNKDKSGEFRFKFVAGNGETVATSEGYKSKDSAMKGIASIKENAAKAPIDDKTT